MGTPATAETRPALSPRLLPRLQLLVRITPALSKVHVVNRPGLLSFDRLFHYLLSIPGMPYVYHMVHSYHWYVPSDHGKPLEHSLVVHPVLGLIYP